jgi:hypothetical protein
MPWPNDLEHLGGGGLLLQRLGELGIGFHKRPALLPHVIEQPHVLDRDELTVDDGLGRRGELIPISAVCRRVDIFTDPLPDEVFDAFYFLAAGNTQRYLKEKLIADRTYATGAWCLLKLIEDRKARWREVAHRTQ